MTYRFSSEKPIFLQLAELIKNEIVSGKLSAGEKLKSVREYSAIYKVNPNTVQKALAELEDVGLIYTDRTNGKFVSSDIKSIEESKMQELSAKVKNFVKEMKNLGLDEKEIIKLIKKENSDE